MSIEEFVEEPWKSSHETYERSVLHIRPAPEFATAEVVVASVYRACGFERPSEREVPIYGREFDKSTQRPPRGEPRRQMVSPETWQAILHGILESPKQPNQSSKRFLQLCPVVPDIALYSGSARLTGNSWNPGALVQRLVTIGSESESSARILWGELFSALSVVESDDVWARWLQHEFVLRRRRPVEWELRELQTGPDLDASDKNTARYPARQFVKDLRAIIDAKPCMTRRQWISLLEAILRLGTVTHVIWLCDVNARLWSAMREIIQTGPLQVSTSVNDGILSCTGNYLTHGNPAIPIVRDYASRYLTARLGINLTLWELQRIGACPVGLGGSREIAELLRVIGEHREQLLQVKVLQRVADMREEEARTIACKKGIGSNLVEFARYVLGQRQTALETLRGYDQGYILRKRGDYSAAPWVVSLGPVAVLAVVHCCLKEAAGPRSIQRLCQHLGWYGIDVDRDDIVRSDLGKKLRMLGLVLDSPDAESGMLLMPPFEKYAEPTGVTGQ